MQFKLRANRAKLLLRHLVPSSVFCASLSFATSIEGQSSRPTALPSVRLTLMTQIGGDFARESDMLVRVTGIGVGREGTMYVLDGGDRAVKVYGRDGRFVRRFGREGSGPGEFRSPTSIWVDSVIRVSDLGQQRISRFSLEGRHLSTDRAPFLGEAPVLRMVPLRHGRMIGVTPAHYGVYADGRSNSNPFSTVLVASPGTPVRYDTLLRYHSGATAYHPPDANVPFGTVDSHVGMGGSYAVLGDSIVATADGYTGTVRWYRVGPEGLRLVRTRQLHSRSRLVSADDRRLIERRVRERSPRFPRELVLETPPRVSVATQALFADDGTLWIRNTGEGVPEHVWTLFDSEGEVSLRIRTPSGFDLRAVAGDRLYGVAKTENDSPLVRVYRMIRD